MSQHVGLLIALWGVGALAVFGFTDWRCGNVAVTRRALLWPFWLQYLAIKALRKT